MESLNKVRSQNILAYLGNRIFTKASSSLMEQFWFNELTNFGTAFLSEDELAKLPVLTPDEAMCLLKRLAPNLKSLDVNFHHCARRRCFLFGSHYVRIPAFNFEHLFYIICAKSFNLERIRLDVRYSCSNCLDDWSSVEHQVNFDLLEAMELIIKNNSNLRAIGLGPDVLFLSELIPSGTKIPSLTEISLIGDFDGDDDYNIFYYSTETLTVIDMSDCEIDVYSLPKLILEISRHKETLECLRLNLTYDANYSKYDVLADLKICSSLKELRIEVDWAREFVPSNFLADILNVCSNLDVLCLTNFSFDSKTLELLEASRLFFRSLVITNNVVYDEDEADDDKDDEL